MRSALAALWCLFGCAPAPAPHAVTEDDFAVMRDVYRGPAGVRVTWCVSADHCSEKAKR